jgi:CopA family copper-resistance protein
VTIRVTNRLNEPTSIHWHGIILPYQMDGVPGISFPGIPPGETFTYRFKVDQTGSYWYHSHSGFQEMTGVYGSLIIDGDEDQCVPTATMRAAVRLDGRGSDAGHVQAQDPERLLQLQPAHRGGLLPRRLQRRLGAALEKRKMWNQMRMSPTDLADLSGATLTYLMNGVTPAGNWTGLFRAGERVRLRFVNGAGNTFYDVRIPGLKLKVIQVDGQNIEPVTVDEFRFGPGKPATCWWSRPTTPHDLRPVDGPHRLRARHAGRARGCSRRCRRSTRRVAHHG